MPLRAPRIFCEVHRSSIWDTCEPVQISFWIASAGCLGLAIHTFHIMGSIHKLYYGQQSLNNPRPHKHALVRPTQVRSTQPMQPNLASALPARTTAEGTPGTAPPELSGGCLKAAKVLQTMGQTYNLPNDNSKRFKLLSLKLLKLSLVRLLVCPIVCRTLAALRHPPESSGDVLLGCLFWVFWLLSGSRRVLTRTQNPYVLRTSSRRPAQNQHIWNSQSPEIVKLINRLQSVFSNTQAIA